MPRTFLLLCLLGALVVPATPAQEPSPPPAGGSDQDMRQIRRERRRAMLRGLLNRAADAVDQQPQAPRPESLDAQDDGPAGRPPRPAAESETKAGAAAPGGQGPAVTAGGLFNGLLPLLRGQGGGGTLGAGAEPLEAGKLNQAMEEEVLRPLAEQLSTVDRLQLRFDPQQTDFARDQLGLRAAAGLRGTPWGAPARLNLNVSARVARQPQQPARAVIAFDIDLLTDMIGLANFAKQRALKRANNTQQAWTDEKAALMEVLQTTPEFTSLTDVVDLLPRIGEVNLRAANQEINRLQAEIASNETGQVDPRLVKQLAKAITDRDNLMAFSFRIRRADGIDAQEMFVSLPGGGISYGFVTLESVDLHLTEPGLVGHVEVSVGQSGVLLYQGAKALVIEPMLRRLQQRDPQTLQNLRRRGRDIGRQLEELPRPAEEVEPLPAPAPRPQ